jgi:hypothetical protein
VNYFLALEQRVPLDADAFYSWLAAKRAEVISGVPA